MVLLPVLLLPVTLLDPVVLDAHSTVNPPVVLLVVLLVEFDQFEFEFESDFEAVLVGSLVFARGTAVGGLHPLSETVVTDPRATAKQIIETAESSCLGIAVKSSDLFWGEFQNYSTSRATTSMLPSSVRRLSFNDPAVTHAKASKRSGRGLIAGAMSCGH